MLKYNIILPASLILLLIHPVMYIPVIYGFYHYRDRLEEEIQYYCEVDSKWFFFLPFSIYAIIYISTIPLPYDDMLRHAVSYQFNYDYSNLFVHSQLKPTINLWIGTEVLAGKITDLVGKEYSIRILQYLTIAVYLAVFIKAIHKLLGDNKNKWIIITVLVLVVLSTTVSIRITAARPELYSATWLMSAVFLHPAIWTIIGILLIPTYWLMPIYICGVLLLKTTFHKKILISTLLILFSYIFWHMYSEGEYIHNILLIKEWFNNRIMGVGENKTLLFQIFDISVFIIISMLFISFTKNKAIDKKHIIEFTVVIIIFLLPDMTRYITTVIPLIIFIIAININHTEFNLNNKTKFIIFLLAIYIAKDAGNMSGKIASQRADFILPKNSVVLTEFNDSLYSTIFHNPNIKIAPSMEIGATDKNIQQLVVDISINNSLNCDELVKHDFTHIIEGSLNMVGTPTCLDLVEAKGKWKLWKVIYE